MVENILRETRTVKSIGAFASSPVRCPDVFSGIFDETVDLFVDESVSMVTVSVFDGTSKSFPSAFVGRIFAIMKNKIPMPLYLIAPIRFNLFKMLPDIFPPNYLR